MREIVPMPNAARTSPLISVIVPCYNYGHFLAEALESISSTSLPVEIVVVDDGSTDDTPDVVATFETPCDLKFVRQQNAGLSAARNRGLRESRGRYVVFLDADDRLAPGALEIGALNLDEHPEAAFVFGRCMLMDVNGELQTTPLQPRIVRDVYRELLRRNYIWTPAVVMFRREAVERAGAFNPKINAAADYELYLHIARHHPVWDHGQVVAHYRRHQGNMSLNSARMLTETLAVIASQRPFLEGDEASLLAYAESRRNWQDFYGTELVDEIRTDIRLHDWMLALRKTLILARRHPRGLWHHATRKTSRVVRGIPPEPRYAGRATPEAEISAATARASSSSGRR
jgi:glycosyltransferase involved in cell wall biosynthesis